MLPAPSGTFLLHSSTSQPKMWVQLRTDRPVSPVCLLQRPPSHAFTCPWHFYACSTTQQKLAPIATARVPERTPFLPLLWKQFLLTAASVGRIIESRRTWTSQRKPQWSTATTSRHTVIHRCCPVNAIPLLVLRPTCSRKCSPSLLLPGPRSPFPSASPLQIARLMTCASLSDDAANRPDLRSALAPARQSAWLQAVKRGTAVGATPVLAHIARLLTCSAAAFSAFHLTRRLCDPSAFHEGMLRWSGVTVTRCGTAQLRGSHRLKHPARGREGLPIGSPSPVPAADCAFCGRAGCGL